LDYADRRKKEKKRDTEHVLYVEVTQGGEGGETTTTVHLRENKAK